ncbi:hypothetical protein [Methylobacterium nigriterrae]|uniref:hypothetical protein n=1 Tax=Methylobacterium nigriterrae TaxID=3127512 RepID=UPI0030135341
MSTVSPHANVVSLLPAEKQVFSPLVRRQIGFASDLASLKALSLQLQQLKREYIDAATAFDETSVAFCRKDPAFRSNPILGQIERLEASMQRLTGAMMTHQPRI